MATFKKPVLRGFHNATIKSNLLRMAVLVAFVGTTFNIAVNNPKKQRYAEFYRNYEGEKSAERMRQAGLLQSAPANPTKSSKDVNK